MLVSIITKAILSDKGFEIIEKMLDRAIGKAGGNIDITTNGEKIQSPFFGDNPLIE
jgi:hypothetical protein